MLTIPRHPGRLAKAQRCCALYRLGGFVPRASPPTAASDARLGRVRLAEQPVVSLYFKVQQLHKPRVARALVSQRKDVCISPQARNAVRVKRRVTAHQWHLLDLRLCNQQTIKRVTMMKR